MKYPPSTPLKSVATPIFDLSSKQNKMIINSTNIDMSPKDNPVKLDKDKFVSVIGNAPNCELITNAIPKAIVI